MVNTKFKLSKKAKEQTWKKMSRSEVKTLPGQSLSINEIVSKYVKGIPIEGLTRRQGVYIDQSDHDLEKVSRMDFAEKAEFAEQLRQHHAEVGEAIKADKRAKDEEARKQKERSRPKLDAAEGSAGIDTLDNTMPDDTKLKPK